MKLRTTPVLRSAPWLAFACLLLLLLNACPGRQVARHQPATPAQEKQAAAEQDQQDSPAKRELIKEYLGGDKPDQRQFALLFVLRFKLQEFRDILRDQAVHDPLAAVVVDCLSGDGKASAAWLDLYPGAQAQAKWFGAVYGFECTAQFPSSFWISALDVTKPNDLTTFCIGMARLDVEPGGPLQIDEALALRLEQLYKEAPASDVLRRFSLDSLLGLRAGRSINFKSYLNSPALQNTSPSQWAGLLRHAAPEVWSAMLSQPELTQQQRQLLLGAAAMAAPPKLSFPDKPRAAEAGSASTDELALLFIDKQIERFPLKQIETLKHYKGELVQRSAEFKTEKEKGDLADQSKLDAAEARLNELQDISRGVIAELSAELRLACLRGDRTSVKYALQQIPLLPESAASGVLSTISRYGSELAGDEELSALAVTGDRGIAYWLVLAWGDRPVIQTTDARRQLLTSPNHENVMLGQAYSKWLQQEGLLTDG